MLKYGLLIDYVEASSKKVLNEVVIDVKSQAKRRKSSSILRRTHVKSRI
jgi:hypothetical protein